MNANERRRYPRLPADLMIMYEELAGDGQDPSLLQRLRTCTVCDISLGGIKILVHQPLPMGTRLKIVMMTALASQPLEIDSTVVWLRPSGEESREIGLEFDPLSPDELERIKDLLLLLEPDEQAGQGVGASA